MRKREKRLINLLEMRRFQPNSAGRLLGVDVGHWSAVVPATGKRVWLLAGVLVCLVGAPAVPQSLDAPLKPVAFKQGDTLRGLVEAELADPDLWPLVLQLSGIAAITEVQPGTLLAMPVQQVRVTDSALRRALDAIQAANAEGARLFAPDRIELAIENRDDAMVQRSSGEWRGAVRLADAATGFAVEALEVSLAQRDRDAEALVTDVQGNVEGRSPDASRWTDRGLNDVLVQAERVRTLSGSTTQITFRDLSRLRLSPNSNATIERMRTDPLTGGEVTKIALVSGDFYALLNQLGEESSFEIDAGGLATQTDSKDFWIKTDDSGARFANYDEAALVVGSGQNAVSLGENEGAVVSSEGVAQVTEVLDRPALLGPADASAVYGRSAALSWIAKPDAAGYWLEVAMDAGFNEMRISEWGIAQTGFEVQGLDQGRYHWRVAALDAFGLPGTWSIASTFDLISDSTPPFLALASPADGALIATAQVVVAGETEPGVDLTLNGLDVEPGADNRFSVVVDLGAGANSLTLLAVDAAGNRTERLLSVVYRPAEVLALTPDTGLPRDAEGRFLTATDQLALVAASTASPGSALRLTDAAGAVVVQSVVGEGGAISLTVPARSAPTPYRLELLSPAGVVEGALDLVALTDSTPPEIDFDTPPPQATATPELRLALTVGDAVALRVNGADLALTEGRAALVAALTDGPNSFEITAEDAVGNVSLRSVSVILDAEPPVISAARINRPEGDAGPLEIEALATDNVGLRAAARYRLAVGEAEEAGVLRCDTTAGRCVATLPARDGPLTLLSVTVEDYAGNKAETEPD